MVLKSKVLKAGTSLINDWRFILRELLNKLKQEREVDTYILLKSNMEAYEHAVSVAKERNKWQAHLNKKRKEQEIAFVEGLGCYCRSGEPEEDIEINECIVHDTKKNEYFVFVTTDLEKTAKQIIMTYELRSEIEEDYRQIKNFY